MVEAPPAARFESVVDSVVPPAAPRPQAVRWHVVTRIAFRFTFVYLTLFLFAKPTGWMRAPIDWTAAHVFHVGYQYATTATGSGDRTIDWIRVFLLLVFSAAAAAVWSVLDRRRPNDAALHKWFHLLLRFLAGLVMVDYGSMKVFPLQMPAPSLIRLLEPFGNFSPMGVLWYSVGASFPYERFAGSMELVAAVLLFVPRLWMLGAMVLVADSIQIFALNMTYDVPVKLFSFHLIVIGLVLLAPEAKRLFSVLVLNRGAGPSALPPLARNVTLNRVLVAAQIVFGAYAIVSACVEARQAFYTIGSGAPRPPLYGIWTVETMTVDGVERAPLVTDYGRWRRFIVPNAQSVAFWRMDDTFILYPYTVDMNAKSIALTKTADKTWKAGFAFQQPSPDVLVLDGEMDGHKIHLDTRLFDRSRFLLVSRGFNWVQEGAFNR